MTQATDIDLFGDRVRPRGVNRDGYAATPGTGPKDQTCQSCAHAERFGRYAKCKLMRHAWTGGTATDIALRSPACGRWARITDSGGGS
ncbi:hypothetical protein [Burkholderia gladioli]|uniref:hypothetical protein n=1 Tax=Burkholderia gladioli TaxID=28095 RepID=UPI001C224B1A|nr:hypothetical protein [Burkholderia gladioli]MBU9174024.1 hypothetical protein [Burkholderia gladioli]